MGDAEKEQVFNLIGASERLIDDYEVAFRKTEQLLLTGTDDDNELIEWFSAFQFKWLKSQVQA